ncbi:MAG TPA: glycosyl hydrolase, partial [Gemmatimonadaceae bacterium]|nr:glycosyl hydrolase [Gemmatimonadaceae bacterium]
MYTWSPSVRALSLALAIPMALGAQRGAPSKPATPAAPAVHPAAQTFALSGPVDTTLWGNIQWRNIGPNVAGRMVSVAGSVSRPNEYYFGTTGGGVWKTTDGGTTLVPVTDKYFGGSVGALAQSESNPDIVYAGGGETQIRGNVSYGDGVWKTTDGGKTWTSMGLRETQYISRIRIDPTNPDVVYVGALGHVFGPNAERGVFKTTDGGKSWKKILYRNDSTGVADLIMEPGNPHILYATMWQAYRLPWTFSSGGAGSGIFKTTDGGDHWTEISHNQGLPTGLLGRMGIAISPVKPNKIWALIENEPGGGVYRSDDRGATWKFLSGSRDLRQRAWYYSNIYADPKDTNVLAAPQVGAEWSKDGGMTWSGGFGAGDNHDVWWAPDDSKRIVWVHDNGAVITKDGGTTRVSVAAPTGQFYHVHLTNHFPYHVCGSKQDAGPNCGPVRVAGGGRGGGGGGGGRGGAAAPVYSEFYGVAGGESGYIASNPADPDIIYGGRVDKLDLRTQQTRHVDPTLAEPDIYRRTWTLPLTFSPRDPKTLFFANQKLHRTRDGGEHWDTVSPDLTRENPAVPATLDASAAANNLGGGARRGVIYAIAPSRTADRELWVGTDDGLIWRSRDEGAHWDNVTPKALTAWSKVGIIDASPFDADSAYVAIDRHRLDDFKPYVYRTHDGGKTWQQGAAGIPEGSFVNAVRADPVRRGLLYAGTEKGVYVSFDDGAHWQSLQKNLPVTSVRDLQVHDNDLVIATHGRGFWILDDIAALRQVNADAAAASAWLFAPSDAVRVRRPEFTGTPMPKDEPMAADPPDGAYIDYVLKAAPKAP